jgi:hypothetical protein
MSFYTGVRFDVKFHPSIPVGKILEISKMIRQEHPDRHCNGLFTPGHSDDPDWSSWNKATLTQENDHWHLKSCGATRRIIWSMVNDFLEELKPWIMNPERHVLALTVDEERETVEHIYMLNDGDIMVRAGAQYSWNTSHPMEMSEEDLALPLLSEAEHPNPRNDRLYRRSN